MSLDKSKTDGNIGIAVSNHLRSINLETSTVKEKLDESEQHKIDYIESKMIDIMQCIGLDLNDDSLVDTPKRIAKMWIREKFWGLHPENFPKITTVQNKMTYDEVLVENDIRVLSECEHHFQVIDGICSIAYKPKEKVLGLSKLNRIVQYFSARPQIQERLTQQIGETVKFITGTDDVAVIIKAAHYCVISRGARDTEASTVTSFVSGLFRENSSVRAELMNLVNIHKR